MSAPIPVVLDTSVLVDVLRGDPRALGCLRRLEQAAEPWSVTVVRAELLAGARAGELGILQRLFEQIRWLDVDVMVADLAGRMAAHYGPAHRGIGLADYLVAAGTRMLGARLLTLNVRHFPMLEGLEPAYR